MGQWNSFQAIEEIVLPPSCPASSQLLPPTALSLFVFVSLSHRLCTGGQQQQQQQQQHFPMGGLQQNPSPWVTGLPGQQQYGSAPSPPLPGYQQQQQQQHAPNPFNVQQRLPVQYGQPIAQQQQQQYQSRPQQQQEQGGIPPGSRPVVWEGSLSFASELLANPIAGGPILVFNLVRVQAVV